MPRVIETEHYLRFERVGAVEETERGLLAALGGERLRSTSIRDDVVRLKISRGGDVRRVADVRRVRRPRRRAPPTSTIERGDGVVRLRTAALVVSLWLDPFRLDVHRPDGSPVVETARDDDGRWWPYATLNDAFAVRRRCRARGPDVRAGREDRAATTAAGATSRCGTPTSSTRTRRPSSRRAARPDDPRGDVTSVEFDPYYVSIPFFHHQDARDRRGRGLVRRQRLPRRATTSRGPRSTASTSRAASTPSTSSPARTCRDVLRAYTWLTGRTAPPPLWSLAYHQCRWFRYTQDAIEALADRHRAEDIPCDALWLDIEYMDGYRVFTWDTEAFPDVAGHARAAAPSRASASSRSSTPGSSTSPATASTTRRVERDVLCRTEGGDVYLGEVWPGDTAFPDFVTEEARAWWGELNADHVRSGIAGIWNDMNEPATGAHPAGADALRPRRVLARALPQPVRRCSWRWRRRRACARRCPTGARSSSPAPGSPASSATPRTGWATTSRAGTTCGSACRWRWASACRASRSSAPTSAASRGTRTPSCSCAGCSTAR